MLSLPFFFFFLMMYLILQCLSLVGLFLVLFFFLIFNIAHLTAVLKYRHRACSLSAYFKIKHIRKKHHIYEL